jgi:hypothetical protein
MSLIKLLLAGNTSGILGFQESSTPDPGKNTLRQKNPRLGIVSSVTSQDDDKDPSSTSYTV